MTETFGREAHIDTETHLEVIDSTTGTAARNQDVNWDLSSPSSSQGFTNTNSYAHTYGQQGTFISDTERRSSGGNGPDEHYEGASDWHSFSIECGHPNTVVTSTSATRVRSATASDPGDASYDWPCPAPDQTVTSNTLSYSCNSTETLSAEYTTEALVSEVNALLAESPLPPWGPSEENPSPNCHPQRLLDITESNLFISRGEYRIVHSPSATCYLKCWLRAVFHPEVGPSIVLGELPTYEWVGTGNPCWAAPDLGLGDLANAIYSEAYPSEEPEENGYISNDIYKFSWLPGYIPPDDGSANGYPPAT